MDQLVPAHSTDVWPDWDLGESGGQVDTFSSVSLVYKYGRPSHMKTKTKVTQENIAL